ncbi:MAG: hypothetical protein H6935_05505 [Thiobacillus sp.]|nr:hypothetical protein [Thiobacillus sp.]
MVDSDKKPEAPKEHPAMGQIVGYLKDYPFLLITIAGLLILSGILIFDLEKLKEFKWLIYAVVLVPLGIQFLIEFKKMQGVRPATAPMHPEQPVPLGPRDVAGQYSPPPGKKAWVSIAISMVLFGVVAALPEMELRDRDFALGFLVATLVATGFGIAAIMDVNHQRAGGKATAVTAIIISAFMALAALGWMTEERGEHVLPSQPPLAGEVPLPVLPEAEAVVATPGLPVEPSPVTPPVQSGIEGRYQLLAHQVDGEPAATGGTLAINRRAPDRYQWQAQLLVPGFGSMQALHYGGQFIQRGGRWFLRITGSNDPDWADMGEVPMEVAFDGRNAAFAYAYDGDHIQSVWLRGN